MSHPYHHAQSTAKRWKGQPEDYLKVHDFFDQTKSGYAYFTHRAVLHNSFGIFLAEQLFGSTIVNSEGKHVPVRVIGEQHVREDLGWIPSLKDWLIAMHPLPWMRKGVAHASDGCVPDEMAIVVTLTPTEAKCFIEQGGSNEVTTQILTQLAEREHAVQ
jgi:hypothetical protein